MPKSSLWFKQGKKTAPVSLRATLKGIRTYWVESQTSKANTKSPYKRFSEIKKVNEVFTRTIKNYSYQGKKKSSHIPKNDQIIRRCEENPRETGTKLYANFIGYTDLRAYADLSGIPTGLLLLFSHMVGDEYEELYRSPNEPDLKKRHDKSSDRLVEFIDMKIKCLEAAKTKILNNRESNQQKANFVRIDEVALKKKNYDTPPYYADISIFEEWRKIRGIGQ